MDLDEEFRCVLVGKTGSGKSSTGNTLLGLKGSESFFAKAAASSQTRGCKIKWAEALSKKLVLVDSPGVCDTKLSEEEINIELAQVVIMTSPGAHAFLLVIAPNRFTDEEQTAVARLKKLFGPEMNKCIIVIFTRLDDLEDDGVTIEEFISGSLKLRSLLADCNNRYMAINNRNKTPEYRNAVLIDLFIMINEMLKRADYKYYCNDDYVLCEKMLLEEIRLREEKLRQEKERERKEIAGKYEAEIQAMNANMAAIQAKLQEQERLKAMELERHRQQVIAIQEAAKLERAQRDEELKRVEEQRRRDEAERQRQLEEQRKQEAKQRQLMEQMQNEMKRQLQEQKEAAEREAQRIRDQIRKDAQDREEMARRRRRSCIIL